MSSFLEALRQQVLLGDGAMGTQLQKAGLEPGGCGEAWNLDHPERVLAIQKAYVEAGSDCLLTNTFGGCSIMLERHGEADRTEAINRAGVEIARQAFGSRRGYVLGDVGPFGGLMEPLGEVSPARVRAALRQQVRALVEAGVDALILETQTSLEELGIGLEEALEAGAPCVIGSLAFDVTLDGGDVRTMMGIDPERAAAFLQESGAHVVALNCGAGVDMAWAARILQRYRRHCDLPLMAQPNAGAPELENLRVVYKESPEKMASGVPALLRAGARLVGGCCGSTPDHIRSFLSIVDTWNKGLDRDENSASGPRESGS